MSPRPRVPRNFELLELVFRTTSLALELASLGLLSYLSVEFVYDHATNPVAYAGLAIATITDLAEVYTLSTIGLGWPQARLSLVIFGDVVGAVLLFFSWTWLITRGMFWSCTLDTDHEREALYGNCGDKLPPSELLQKLSWALPFTMAGMHLVIVILYCSALRRRVG